MKPDADYLLDEIVRSQKSGKALGVPSVCSANEFVIEASLLLSQFSETPILIESTCNQVNQFGGYTGLTPMMFRFRLKHVAHELGFAPDQIILGGDHLGPNVWKDESASSAMKKSSVLVHDYVRAGYTKIHLDASMHCADDPQSMPLDKRVSAMRTAKLAKTAEEAFKAAPTGRIAPRYVIGTEVPTPGGEPSHSVQMDVTSVAEIEETIELSRKAFFDVGLEDAWMRVIAVVVQPGVDFGAHTIHEYSPRQTVALSRLIENYERLVYEAHSTDFQTRGALKSLVHDHFAILKVGPSLTFAFREAVFSLAMIEQELHLARMLSGEPSDLRATLEKAMLEKPEYWQKYYTGTHQHQQFARKYGFSDRSRYYWASPNVRSSIEKLLHNLGTNPIPLSLLSQFLPSQYSKVREGMLINNPRALIIDRIASVLSDYVYACNPSIGAAR